MANTLPDLVAACARRIPARPQSFQHDRPRLAPDLDALMAAIRQSDDRFAFDDDGRPGAVAAVRRALPSMEAELLDAILDDVACELAAYQEGLYQLAAFRRNADGSGSQ
jgi:hypothetical protein